MHVVSVIPLSRGIPFDVLTYYAAEQLLVGTVVIVPLGKTRIYGIVLESGSLMDAKTFVKQAAFSLKKIHSVVATVPLFAALAESVRESAALSLVPAGTIASGVIPQALFEYVGTEKLVEILNIAPDPSKHTEDAIGAQTDERADTYKRLTRTWFAQKKSVLLVAPTIRALEVWKEKLHKGIDAHIVLFHSKLSKKDMRAAYTRLKDPAPVLIVTTPGWMISARNDIGQIIVEDESSSLYKSNDRYGFDARLFIRSYAKHIGCALLWGDTLPRIEVLARTQKEHLPRTYVPENLVIVPCDPYRSILPSEVVQTLRHAQAKKQRLYIYASRKGLAPLSRCSDCGTIVNCKECSLPMVLRTKTNTSGERIRSFVCTHCAATLPATHVCEYCGSWNITPVSIGSESIYDAVSDIVGSENIILIDDDTTPDGAAVKTAIEALEEKKFAVIIGTVKVLPYLKSVHYSLFPFFDRMLSTPSLYTIEHALRLIMATHERSRDGVLLFTKNPEFPFIKQLEMKKINAIISEELTLRKSLGYPPYGSIVKISVTVPEGFRQKVHAQVSTYLSGIDHSTLAPRRISTGSMKVLLVWILTVPTTYIEEYGPELSLFLSGIHFPFSIEENPERL